MIMGFPDMDLNFLFVPRPPHALMIEPPVSCLRTPLDGDEDHRVLAPSP